MRANSRPHKILVVDDDALIREMMTDILDDYSVQTARNGREALDTLRSGERLSRLPRPDDARHDWARVVSRIEHRTRYTE